MSWANTNSSTLKHILLSATTSYVLLPVSVVYACIAWWLQRIERRESSSMYWLVTAAAAAVSLGLAMWFGFGRAGDPQNITWLLAIYAAGALAGIVLRRADVTRVGSALLLAALVQCIVFRYGAVWQLAQPWVTALLTHATFAGVLCSLLSPQLAGRLRTPSAIGAAQLGDVRRMLALSSVVTSFAAAGWTLATAADASPSVLAIHAGWLAAIWVLLAILQNSAVVFTASQIAVVLAIVFGATAAVERFEWYAAARRPWLDPWYLELVGTALAGFCLLMIAIRWFVSRPEAR